MELDEDDFRARYRKDWRTPEWRAFSAKMIAKRGNRCQRCGRRGPRGLVVHHVGYLFGRRAWEYDDAEELLEVVCNGRRHREADCDREDQNRLDKIHKEFGPEALTFQPPHRSELRKFAKVERRFMQWVIESGRLPTDYDDRMWPPWQLWNLLSREFYQEVKEPNDQSQLDLDL